MLFCKTTFNYPLIIVLLSITIIYTKSPLEINNQKLPDITKFEKIIKDLFPENEPGAAVLIMKEGKVLFEKYYGLSSLPNKTKVDCNSNFCIASISKQFTAVSILQLVSKGKVSLEEPLFTYFPEYTNPLWKKVKLSKYSNARFSSPYIFWVLFKYPRASGIPEQWLNKCFNLIFFHKGFVYSGKYVTKGSSKETFPFDTNCKIATAVNCLEIEAMQKLE